MPNQFEDEKRTAYHGNHSGKRPEGAKRGFGGRKARQVADDIDFSPENARKNPWAGTQQRNFAAGVNAQRASEMDFSSEDPRKRAEQARRDYARSFSNEEELPENLLVGRNPIREALRAGRPMEKLMVMKGDLSGAAREIVSMAREAGVVVQEVEKNRLDQVYRNHQGLLAFVSSASYTSFEDLLARMDESGETPFLILLDGITDPHNLGAIIRSAECAGAQGVIIPERRSAGLNPACVKAAAGALEYMPVARVGNLSRAIEELKERGIWVYAADMGGENAYEADLSGPCALVIGAEGDGISPLVAKHCDKILSIPMKGHINSLNASVAAGILLMEVSHRR